MTASFKPGITWFGNALERKGINTTYDAVEGYERYIDRALDVIYQTDNIQNLRALEHVIREKTSDEAVRQRIKELREDGSLSEDERDSQIKQAQENGKYALGNFVQNLAEYTNLLANKRARRTATWRESSGARRTRS